MELDDIEKLIGELELGVDRLRSLYEQYFMGIEKIEPQVPRKDVDRRIYALRREQIRNTAQRFRFHMVLQRYNTYQTYWQRICREIENGTYKRHIIRAQARFGDVRREAPAPTPSAMRMVEQQLDDLASDFELPPTNLDDLDIDVELGDEWRPAPPPPPPSVPSVAAIPRPPATTPGLGGPPAPASVPAPAPLRVRPTLTFSNPPLARSKPPPAPQQPAPQPAPPAKQPAPAAKQPPPPARPAPAKSAQKPAPRPAPAPAPVRPGDLPEARVRQLYSEYVETKRRQNESTATITYDAVARTLRESSARLHEKHGKKVDFEVAVRDGKTILKPVLK